MNNELKFLTVAQTQRLRKKIRKQMLEDGFSEYNGYGLIDSETSEKWNTEFQKRISNA